MFRLNPTTNFYYFFNIIIYGFQNKFWKDIPFYFLYKITRRKKVNRENTFRITLSKCKFSLLFKMAYVMA